MNHMRVRLIKGKPRSDGATTYFVPMGMTGTVQGVLKGRLCVVWDYTFVSNIAQDRDHRVLENWEDREVPFDVVEFVGITALEDIVGEVVEAYHDGAITTGPRRG